MPFSFHAAPAGRFRLAALKPAPARLFGLVTLSSMLASLALACATPFAAFAVIAAATMPLSLALFVIAGAWLVNQAVGFGVHHYPLDTNTVLWGLAILAAALVATLTSACTLRARLPAPLALATALLAAFGAYELAIFAAQPLLGGEASFSAAVIGRLGLLNMAWLAGLVAVCEIARPREPRGESQKAARSVPEAAHVEKIFMSRCRRLPGFPG